MLLASSTYSCGLATGLKLVCGPAEIHDAHEGPVPSLKAGSAEEAADTRNSFAWEEQVVRYVGEGIFSSSTHAAQGVRVPPAGAINDPRHRRPLQTKPSNEIDVPKPQRNTFRPPVTFRSSVHKVVAGTQAANDSKQLAVARKSPLPRARTQTQSRKNTWLKALGK